MKLVMIADWLPTFAGAEHVIAAMRTIWPAAPLYTTIAAHGHLGPLDAAEIHTSGLQPFYKILGNHRPLLPWMPGAIERMDLSGYDVVLSSSHAVGKGIVPPSTAVHVCYCHTPMRYAWEMEDEYLEDFRIPNFLRKRVKHFLTNLRRWDLTTAQRVDVFIANSTTTQERIRRLYGRESTVIHPPIEDRFFQTELVPREKRSYYLGVGRLVPYKRFDLMIEAANNLKLPLKIAGSGPEMARLQRLAGPTVEMLGFVPDSDLPGLYASAKAFLFPPFEDAGVVPLEAQATGTPVIAFGKGGALDTVESEKTGVFFPEQSATSLIEAITRLNTIDWDPAEIRNHAAAFGMERFRSAMETMVQNAVSAYGRKKASA